MISIHSFSLQPCRCRASKNAWAGMRPSTSMGEPGSSTIGSLSMAGSGPPIPCATIPPRPTTVWRWVGFVISSWWSTPTRNTNGRRAKSAPQPSRACSALCAPANSTPHLPACPTCGWLPLSLVTACRGGPSASRTWVHSSTAPLTATGSQAS
jgi:hypothetical protein